MIQRSCQTRGWGVFVTFCAFMSICIVVGFSFAFGVLYMHLLDYFKASASATGGIGALNGGMFYVPGIQHAFGILYMHLLGYFNNSAAAVSTIGGINGIFFFATGPIVSVISNFIGLQQSVVLGGVLSCLGLFFSGFADSIYVLYITFGVIAGIGFGFVYLPWIGIISSYFQNEQYRDSAICVATAGIGIGTFIWPPLLEVLIKEFGWRGALWISAGICLQICILGFLSPVKMRPKTTEPLIEKNNEQNVEKRGKMHISAIQSTLKMFCDWRYCCLMVSEAIWNSALMIFATIVPDFARREGHPEELVGLLLSVFGGTNLCCRILMAVLSVFFPSISKSKMYVVAVASGISAVALSVYPSARFAFIGMCAISAVFGISYGLKYACLNCLMASIFGPENATACAGNLAISIGIGSCAGPPLGGLIFDISKSYDGAFYVSGGLCLVSTLLYIPILIPKKPNHPNGAQLEEPAKELPAIDNLSPETRSLIENDNFVI